VFQFTSVVFIMFAWSFGGRLVNWPFVQIDGYGILATAG